HKHHREAPMRLLMTSLSAADICLCSMQKRFNKNSIELRLIAKSRASEGQEKTTDYLR
ncbi:hypothetical protein Csa_023515, partial [Cucumis sativus]